MMAKINDLFVKITIVGYIKHQCFFAFLCEEIVTAADLCSDNEQLSHISRNID